MKSPFQPIATKGPRYRQTAYSAIKEGLLSGQIRFDQPLVEEQIAAALQISRTPVREALAILEHEGVISPRGGRGLSLRLLSRREFDERFTANELLEPALARRAAHFITEEQLHAMQQTLQRERYAAAEGSSVLFWSFWRQFHRQLGDAAENLPAADFVARNSELVALFLLGKGIEFPAETLQTIHHQHEAIWDALLRRDPDEAARLMIVHAQGLREIIQQRLEPDAQGDDLYHDLDVV